MIGGRPTLLRAVLPFALALFCSPLVYGDDELTVEALTKRARPSIVVVEQKGRESKLAGIGTGFVVSADGLIVTNLHVIGEAREFTVRTVEGKELPVVAIHAWDRTLDLAVIKVDAQDLPALELGDAEQTTQGESIVVLGNPHGLKHSVVSGILSGRRELENRKLLQLAIPIEPGNSGGPALDRRGRVLGVVTMKSAVTENLGFAVEVNSLKPLLEKPNSVPLERWLTIGAIDAKEWTALNGARWRQRAGRIEVSGAGDGFGGRSLLLAAAEPPGLPFELGVTVKLNDEAGAAGLVFHADGGHKHYGFYPSAGKLRLSRFDGPDVFQWNVLAEKPSAAYRPGEWNRLKVRVEKDKLTCYVNDEPVIVSHDAVFTGGKVGLAKFRTTEAEFRKFQVAAELPGGKPNAELAGKLGLIIDALPALAKVAPENLTALAGDGAVSVDALRKRAREARARAAELERIAADLRTHAVVADLAKVAGPKVEAVDLLRASLLIAQLDEEDIDVDAYVKQVERMAGDVRTAAKGGDESARLAALVKYLFDDNGFHGSRLDYYNPANSYLNRVIDDREGLPITLAVLFMEFGRRLDLNIEGVGLPGHFVVRHVPNKGEPQILDVFEGAKPLTLDEAKEKVADFAGREATEEDLAASPPRAILLRMLHNLLGVAQRRSEHEAMLRYLDAMLAIDPTLVRERGLRAVVKHETGRTSAAIAELDWFLEHRPAGIDPKQIRAMQEQFRK